jgi:phosphoribosylcarboxyaminoimidazole (NCAIR) mutase
MDKAAAYAISAGLVGFGVWIAIAGLSSSVPGLWICAALIPIAVGLISAVGPT